MADNVLGLFFEISADPSKAEAALKGLEGTQVSALSNISAAITGQNATVAGYNESIQKAGEAARQWATETTGAMQQVQQGAALTGDTVTNVTDRIIAAHAREVTSDAARLAATMGNRQAAAVVEVVWETAQGIGALARYDFWSASQHFLSAAEYGILAGRSGARSGAGAAVGGGLIRGPVVGPVPLGGSASAVAGAPAPALAPGTASATSRPSGNVTVMVVGEPQAATWLTKVINTGVLQHDLMLVASHTKRSAPAGR